VTIFEQISDVVVGVGYRFVVVVVLVFFHFFQLKKTITREHIVVL
jgi:hypothetical protein